MIAVLSAKSVKRAVQSQGTPSKKAIASLKEVVDVCKESNLDIPAGLQAIVTQIVGGTEAGKQTSKGDGAGC